MMKIKILPIWPYEERLHVLIAPDGAKIKYELPSLNVDVVEKKEVKNDREKTSGEK